MLVPDAKKMSQAIENHVEEHRKKEKDLHIAKAEAERIEALLIAKVFEKVSH